MELKFKSSSNNKPLLGSVPAIYLYEITYSYETRRKNLKKRTRQVISEDRDYAKIKLIEYI
ncbi:MAG: hypothetical protein ACRDDY_07910, partial [Clostridium sp.]|uniref:hypothetical protein n=1 Tax=Clostridium sp. TaxID=1506 RepID=UPI003EE75789